MYALFPSYSLLLPPPFNGREYIMLGPDLLLVSEVYIEHQVNITLDMLIGILTILSPRGDFIG